MSTPEDHPLNDCTYTIDRFFYCMSPAGQFTTYYRSGNINECAKEWRDVRYCIRNWTNKGEEKRIALQEHLKQDTELQTKMPNTVWKRKTCTDITNFPIVAPEKETKTD